MRRASVFALLLATTPVLAQVPPRSPAAVAQPAQLEEIGKAADASMRVLNGQLPAENAFAPVFLAQVPASKLGEIGKSLNTQYGPILSTGEFTMLRPWAASFNFHFAKVIAKASIEIDPQTHLITGLMITDIVTPDDSIAAIETDFASLPGLAGFEIDRIQDGRLLAIAGRNNTSSEFAIGSAFKLWVLDALAEDVARGKRKWSDVVPLGRPSLPSGETQRWPVGTPMTLASLATLMISISDNTATDTLMNVLGRDAIAARVRATGHGKPSLMLPMLTTLEAFSLKTGPLDRAEAYAKADDAGQTAMLSQFDPTFSADRIDLGLLSNGKPRMIDTIEWFATPADVARVLLSLQRRTDPRVKQILGVNPGLDPGYARQFAFMGFKGGSEEGVLNLSWLVQTRRGTWFAVTTSWNDTQHGVDSLQFVGLARRLLDQVKDK